MRLRAYRKFRVETAGPTSPQMAQFTRQWFLASLEFVWAETANTVDWEDLEQFLRDVLASNISPAAKVQVLREGVAAFTRRGPVSAPSSAWPEGITPPVKDRES